MGRITLSETNMLNIQALKEVILIEEGHEVTTDEAIHRVLEFYRRFVPYN